MSVYFTSDTHFGHENIIQMCNRPFANTEAMDEAMIERWNERVRPGDKVYHLGDFSFRSATGADKYLARLNGEIHLIAGNHDNRTLEHHAHLFASVHLIHELRLGSHWLVLCHYPMREWHGSWRGSWHLFGHVHSRLDHQPHGFSLDVGVDSHDFRPWSLEEIDAAFANRANPFSSGRRPERAAT